MMVAPLLRRLALTVLAVVAATLLHAAEAATPDSPDWVQPFPPFRIADNLYFVGSRGLGNFLVTTPAGHVLINVGLAANVPMMQRSIEQLGFKVSDVRVLLISHAHWDHVAGLAAMQALSGAKVMVMEGDADVIESGGHSDWFYGRSPATWYPPVKVDRVLHDGDTVELGGVVLTAHLTPGHTKGCTTWTLPVKDGGQTRNVVIVGSVNVNDGFSLVNNRAYPHIADDYARAFRVLRALPADVFLGAHGAYFGLEAKFAARATSAANPFIDPAGYRAYLDDRERAFLAELKRQQAASTP